MAEAPSAAGPSSPGPGGSHESAGDGSPRANVREQDRFLPIANISRIMKKALPANAKIAKDSKETVQECISEFISFITSEASDKCQREKRKTINGDDLLWAMATLGFEDYMEPLKSYLQKYREIEGDAKGSARKDGGSSQAGSQPASGSQVQGTFTQSMNHMHSQDLQTRKTIGGGHESGGLYYLTADRPFQPHHALLASDSSYQWHCRLGHPSISKLRDVVSVPSTINKFDCDA